MEISLERSDYALRSPREALEFLLGDIYTSLLEQLAWAMPCIKRNAREIIPSVLLLDSRSLDYSIRKLLYILYRFG